MKKRRVTAGLLSLALTLTASTSVLAASFSDVDNDATVSWAKDSIQKMADSGYIKGYEDGTFKPYRAISKMECLILMARMLGAEESAYAEVATNANALYSTLAGKYNTTYTKELAYLLYTGILTESDLTAYASESKANTELSREEAAVLMAKLLGANTAASAYKVSKATYPDDAEISAAAKPYVEYVTAQSIMNGMASADGSATVFSPKTSLTRAQMATLLSRMIAKINKSCYSGTVTSVDTSKQTVTLDRNGNESKRTVTADTAVYYKGEAVTTGDLEAGDVVGAVEIGGHIQLLYVTGESAVEDDSKSTSVYAVISMLSGGSAQKITLADPEDSSNTATYTVADNCSIKVDGVKATFNDLAKKDFVKVTVNNGKAIAIEVTDSSFVVNGTLNEVTFDSADHIYVDITEKDGTEQTYVVATKGATVVRDGQEAEYRALSSGDTVKLTVSNGKVTRITATSVTEEFTGTLSEIHITANPYLTITVNGKEKEYKLRSDAKIKIAGADASIYELRRNITVSGTLDGSEIKTLSTSTVASTTQGEVSGTVVGSNTGYKVINIEDANGTIQSIYYNNKTTFLKSNGNSTTAKEIENGATVTVTGSEKNGIFEATIVIVK